MPFNMVGVNDFRNRRDDNNARELAARIAATVPSDGTIEPLPGVVLTRVSRTTERAYAVAKPALCVIAQGAKEIYVGGNRYRYDAEHYLLATAELPVNGIVCAASEEPYLSLRVDLDQALVGSVMVECGLLAPTGGSDLKGLGVASIDPDLLDAATRLVRLADSPHANTLAPLVKREIVYRLLVGEQGHRLRHFPAPGGHAQLIAEALQRLRTSLDQPLRIDRLARDLGMSSTRFHHHFKAVTDMSPLQYQKQLRLQEARRLMLGEDLDAAGAGYRVGYDDPSHFNRDYKRHFGRSPMRDVQRLRSIPVAG